MTSQRERDGSDGSASGTVPRQPMHANATISSLLVLLPLLVAYAAAAVWIGERWVMEDSDYAHGPVLPLVAAWAVWMRRAQLRAVRIASDQRGWLLLVPGLFVHLVGAALTVDSISAASLIVTVPGVVWLLGGLGLVRALAPALGLLPFAVPLPIYVTGKLAFELKEIAISFAMRGTDLLGLDAVRQGVSIVVSGASDPILVADACSGLRSLVALTTLGYCVAFLLPGKRALWRRWTLLGAAVPLAVTGNVFRIGAICVLASQVDTAVATGVGHDVLSALAWLVVLGGLLGLDALLGIVERATSRSDATPVTPLDEPAAVAASVRAPRTAVVVALWGVALWICWLSFDRPFAPSRKLAAGLPTAVGPFEIASEFELTPRHHELLGTDDAVWRRYRGPGGREYFVVAVFHGTNWKSVHPPQICLRGSNMDLVRDVLQPVRFGSGQTERLVDVGFVTASSRDVARRGHVYVALHVFGTASWMSGSYTNFFLRHVPRAVFRLGNDGFLLRVETWRGADETEENAARRCAALLEGMVAEAQGLVAEPTRDGRQK